MRDLFLRLPDSSRDVNLSPTLRDSYPATRESQCLFTEFEESILFLARGWLSRLLSLWRDSLEGYLKFPKVRRPSNQPVSQLLSGLLCCRRLNSD